jgi:glyoxylase-like metal-dependent hydrolase (beta-lactamase superfamily II)
MTAPLTLGRTRLARVGDDIGRFPLERLFPTADRAAFDAERPALEPWCVEPQSGDLLISFHSWLIRREGLTILVDACIGEHKDRPLRPAWHQRSGTPYLSRLKAEGVAPEQVDCVLCTHLHADHVGWNTRLENGRWVPTFPNARYLVGKRELAHAQHLAAHPADPPEDHGSFADSVQPLLDAGRIEAVEETHEIADGLRLAPAFGHTPGMVMLRVEQPGARPALLTGDVIHHPLQLAQPAASSRFCEDAAGAATTRRKVLEEAADRDAYLLTAHFPGPEYHRVARDGARFRLR